MGEVYRAKDTNLGGDVAIKVLSDSFTQDPERKARLRFLNCARRHGGLPCWMYQAIVLGQLIPAAPARNTPLLLPTGTEYHVGHEQNTPTMARRDSDRSAQTDVLLREEPDKEEDDEEDEGNVTDDEGDDDQEDDGGYSVQVCRLCRW